MFRSLSIFLVLTFHFSLAWAQVTTATILGTVKDNTGGVLPGVEITVTHLDTNTVRTTVSDDLGQYRVSQLPLGDFEVEAALAGFQTSIRRGLDLGLGQQAVVNITMSVGAITEEVIVTGAAPLVETTSSELTGLVGDKKIRDLPLNGRSFTELALLQPGVVAPRAAGVSLIIGMGQKISVNGSRISATSFILDGTDINDSMGQSPGSANGVLLGVETVREMQTMLQTFSAEYGRAAGGVISAVTKSGTNQFHGSVFEFHRNSALNASNFFEEKASKRSNQFGFVVDGPIVKDKTFFVASYEGVRNREGQTTGIVDTPNALARQGLLPLAEVTSCSDPRSGGLCFIGVDALVAPYLDLYPLPTGSDNGDGTGEWNQSFNRTEDEDYFLGKVDHNLSESDSLFVRYTFQEGANLLPGSYDLRDLDNKTRNQYVTIEHKHIFSPTLLNVVRVGFNRSRLSAVDKVNDPRLEGPGLAFEPGKTEMGDIDISGGISSIGRAFNQPRVRALNIFEYNDTVTFTMGRHSVKFGGKYQRYQQNHEQANNHRGSYDFNSLEDFLLNQPDDYSGALVGFDDYVRGDRQHIPALFIQDDFQFRPNLTINLGLRWEAATANKEVNGKTAAINVVTDTLSHRQSPSYEIPLNNFSPRLGFAWDPSGEGKTAVRGGAGMFHSMILGEAYLGSRQLFPMIDILGTRAGTTFPNPLLAPPLIQARRIDPIDTVMKTPYYVQYNLNVQRELVPNLSLMVGYVGSRGINLTRYVNPNQAVADILPDGTFYYPDKRDQGGTGAECFTTDPDCVKTISRYPAFTRVRKTTNGSDSWYNALQLSLQKRFSSNYQFQVSYSYSKSIDTASGKASSDWGNIQTLPQNYYDIKQQRAVSAFHMMHAVTANYSWELPYFQGMGGVVEGLLGGWTLNGIMTITSGTPFTIEINDRLDNERDRSTSNESRPSLVAGASNNPILGDPALWVDPAAFELAPAGFYGDVGRTTATGDDFANFDFSMGKNTRIGEVVTLQFRAELFNIFNQPNFRHPSRQVFSGSGRLNSSFGRVTRTDNTSRQIQFALKLLF
jgi:hypothetical protein